MYVEMNSRNAGAGAIQSGIAIANNSSTATTVNFELTSMNGVNSGLTATVVVPPFGHLSKFVHELFPALVLPFQGILRAASSNSISMVNLRTRYNERRTTIFTSNYEDTEDITDPDSLLFRIGFRMRSRLHEMCDFVRLEGVDFRELGPNATPEEIARLDKKGRPSSKDLPRRASKSARAQLRDGKGDLKWTGGKLTEAGSGRR
jgi:hypothetical protein